jgi:hypothetical protein
MTENVPHPSYSPGLAPSDFWLLVISRPHLSRSRLMCQNFIETVTEFLEEIQPSELEIVCQPPDRRLPLLKKQLGVFLQMFNILRKKGEVNFKRGGIG